MRKITESMLTISILLIAAFGSFGWYDDGTVAAIGENIVVEYYFMMSHISLPIFDIYPISDESYHTSVLPFQIEEI